MRDENIILGLTLKHLNNLSVESFEDRLLIQKKIYCAQILGVDYGYRYNWYLRGPYSPDLTSAVFETIKEGQEQLEGYELNERITKVLSTVNELACHKNRGYLSVIDWYELLASIHFLKANASWVKPKDESSICHALLSEKPKYKKEDFDAAWSVLGEMNIHNWS